MLEIAPRDILGGMEWAPSIIEGLEGSRVMVLVFSSHANASKQIGREVECAFEQGILVVPLRIENVPPGKGLQYFLGNVHWLDAITPPFEQHLDRIGDTIKILISRVPADGGETARRSDAASTPPEALSRKSAVDEARAREEALGQARRAAAAARLDKARADEASKVSRESRPIPPVTAEPKPGSKDPNRSIVIGSLLILTVLALAYFGPLRREEVSAPAAPEASAESSPDQGAASVQAASAAAQATANADELAGQKHARDEAAFCANFTDCAAALKELRKSAAQGKAASEASLGDMYLNGFGVDPDYAQALNWYRLSAAQGYAYGESLLGDMYYYGHGVEPDYVQALNWYRKAAAQGNASAQYSLGYMYQYGKGVEPNNAEALDWYRKAAAQGNADALTAINKIPVSSQ
jgi:TPR repeat protein